jgi:hypothetical protein
MKGPQHLRALAFLLLTWATAAVPTVAQTPASAQKAQLPGLPNFGRISQQSIPWRGSNNPTLEQIVQFLELLRANPDKKVFVHCQRGAERTGVMVASYRMSHDNWTGEQALNEMELFGFRGLRFGHLKKFVREFPSLLQSNPLLPKLDLGIDKTLLHWPPRPA